MSDFDDQFKKLFEAMDDPNEDAGFAALTDLRALMNGHEPKLDFVFSLIDRFVNIFG